MALNGKSALGAVIGLAGLISTVANPNFNEYDIHNPHNIIAKANSNMGYNGSGLVYVVSTSATAAAGLGLVYNALSGNLNKKEKTTTAPAGGNKTGTGNNTN